LEERRIKKSSIGISVQGQVQVHLLISGLGHRLLDTFHGSLLSSLRMILKEEGWNSPDVIEENDFFFFWEKHRQWIDSGSAYKMLFVLDPDGYLAPENFPAWPNAPPHFFSPFSSASPHVIFWVLRWHNLVPHRRTQYFHNYWRYLWLIICNFYTDTIVFSQWSTMQVWVIFYGTRQNFFFFC